MAVDFILFLTIKKNLVSVKQELFFVIVQNKLKSALIRKHILYYVLKYQLKIVYFVSSAESRIFPFLRVAQALVATRSCVKLRLSALDTKYTILFAVQRTSAGKSTFRRQNDTDKANFRFTADKKFIIVEKSWGN